VPLFSIAYLKTTNNHDINGLTASRSQYSRTYDLIFYASARRKNSVPQTVFNERGLALVADLWSWAITLELVRYAKQDPVDCAVVLHLGITQRSICQGLAGLEQWITGRCWLMVYPC